MRIPFSRSKLHSCYAPLVMGMLVKGINAQQMDGSSIVLKAAIAASFVVQCERLNLDLKKLRKSVSTRIREAAKLFQQLRSRFSFAPSVGDFDECLSLASNFQSWADQCSDASSFGKMMSWPMVKDVLYSRTPHFSFLPTYAKAN
jgi:hypothetical protein